MLSTNASMMRITWYCRDGKIVIEVWVVSPFYGLNVSLMKKIYQRQSNHGASRNFQAIELTELTWNYFNRFRVRLWVSGDAPCPTLGLGAYHQGGLNSWMTQIHTVGCSRLGLPYPQGGIVKTNSTSCPNFWI